MFTGIVEELGEVVALERGRDWARLTVRAGIVAADAAVGASIAVDGVCLTVVQAPNPSDVACFTADVMAETLRRTSLGAAGPARRVNLERPVTPSGRLGGHIVQGHVDGTGTVLARTPGERWETVRVDLPARLSRYVVEKGSIAVDGVSLTVSAVSAPGTDTPWFEVSLIPETLSRTTLGLRAPGDAVNLEVDVLAKHVERLLAHGALHPAAVTS
jgi:riboflavin synthase